MAGSYTYSELAKKLNNFYAPAYEIKVGASDIVKNTSAFVTNIRVDQQLTGMAGCATFDVINIYDQKNSKFSDSMLDELSVGSTVEISLGYGSELVKVFKGYIANISADFSGGSLPSIQVTCLDVIALMMETMHQIEGKEEKKHSAIVEERLKKPEYSKLVAAKERKITASTDEKMVISQKDATDYEYISRLARDLGYEFFVLQGNVYFREAMSAKDSIMTLNWGESMLSFSRELGAAAQITEITVKGRIRFTGEEVSHTVTRKDATGPKITKFFTMENVNSAEDVKRRAESEMQLVEQRSQGGHGACVGLPIICPGRYITIGKLATGIDGTYYINSVSHNLGGGGFTTSFTLGVEK